MGHWPRQTVSKDSRENVRYAREARREAMPTTEMLSLLQRVGVASYYEIHLTC